MQRLLCPSLMCADMDSLKAEVQALDSAGSDIFHIDIMDGSFVPNYALGLEDFKCVRRHTQRPVDAHLMVQNPKTAIGIFANAGADILYVHAESSQDVSGLLLRIQKLHKKSGLAINPGTSFETIQALLPLCDYVLVMTVNPGFAGQSYLDAVDEKLNKLIAAQKTHGYQLVVDGGITPERLQGLSRMGVNGFVLGTSALFGKGDYTDTLERLRGL